MKLKVLSVLATLSLTAFLPLAGWAQRTPQTKDEKTALLDKWVAARRLISREENDWLEQKKLLSYNIDLLKTEISGLNEKISASEEQAKEAERKQAVLRKEENTLREASKLVEGRVRDYEGKIKQFEISFPSPLQNRITKFLAQIPEVPGFTNLSLSERLSAILSILEEVDKFNGSITVVSELRDVGSGETVEVKTMYLGLAQGFFVDQNQQFAAIGKPGPKGWEWTTRNELARSISRSIAMYENLIKPAEFIELPVTVQ